MNIELENQRLFWDSEIDVFDSIYSGSKRKVSVLLDKFFRRDTCQRTPS